MQTGQSSGPEQQPTRVLLEAFQQTEVLSSRKRSSPNEDAPKEMLSSTPTAGRTTSTRDLRRKPLRRTQSSDANDLLRERNRIHQATYKLKQKKLVQDLETSIQKLRDEIQQFKVQRQVLSIKVSTSTTVWSVVTEYFRLFRNGIESSNSATDPPATLGSQHYSKELVQRNFLQQTMTPDVTDGTVRGIDAFIKGWKLVSLYHGDIDIRLVNLSIDAGDSLIATTKGTHSINESTLRFAFPHLVSNGGGEQLSSLAARMVGQKLEVQGSVLLNGMPI
ncbi:von Willebrand factor A domain-containing protein 8 [Phytophthora boehmeriae]|uniref:von Willebrand factor A domain-containing protein 8 n=1 Tax=Phytophthora boehmeriae TaxID=109152 RepID=A0A8T1WRG7_9STRA|nr:von Willebrand factor A domain-containing protein 8 [Phytophthora boehmeriae]